MQWGEVARKSWVPDGHRASGKGQAPQCLSRVSGGVAHRTLALRIICRMRSRAAARIACAASLQTSNEALKLAFSVFDTAESGVLHPSPGLHNSWAPGWVALPGGSRHSFLYSPRQGKMTP